MSDLDPSSDHVFEAFIFNQRKQLLASPTKMSDVDPSLEHVLEGFKELLASPGENERS